MMKLSQSVLYMVLLAVLLAVLIAGIPALTASAATNPGYYFDYVNVDIAVQQNGDLQVREVHKYIFESGDFHGGFRYLPMDRLVSVDTIQVKEGETPYPSNPAVKDWVNKRRSSGKVTGEEVRAFSTWVDDNKFWIGWWFPTVRGGSKTMEIKYTVHGALRVYDGGDQLYWKPVWPDRNARINEVSVKVTFPTSVDLKQATVASYGAKAVYSVTAEPAVAFSASGIAPDQELEIKISFPHGLIAAQAQPWQAEQEKLAGYNQQYKPYVNLALFILGLLVVPLLAFAWIRSMLKKRGKAPSLVGYEGNRYSPPDNLPPALVEFLVSNKSGSAGLTATIFDLGKQGAIQIQETQEKAWYGTEKDYVITRLKDNLQFEFEQLVAGALSSQQGVKLSEKVRAMPGLLKEFSKNVEETSINLGLYEEKPSVSMRRILLPATVVLFVSLIAGIAALAFLFNYAEFIFVPFLALFVASIVALCFSGALVRYSQDGYVKSAAWKSFGSYLKKTARDSALAQENVGRWDSYFPFAVVFGIADPWISRFSQLDAQAPVWFYPYHIGGTSSSIGTAAGSLSSIQGAFNSMISSISGSSSSGSDGGSSGGGGGGGGGGAI